MTAYFDNKAFELRELRAAGATPHHDSVRRWVQTLVTDIAIVCEFERAGRLAFPEDLRDKAYIAILKCSPEHWPCGVPGFGVDYETDDQGMRLFSELVENLHDIFHAAAYAGWPGGDNPRSPVVAMDSRMEERCAELIAANPSLTLPPLPPVEVPVPDNKEESA